jgi:Histidine kinase-, DNA gyrase B-, and HSP90-like ATPase
MGETRVDLLHLLEDLRDAYPGSTEETILTEIVANALDSGAARIVIDTDASAPAVTIRDDGAGMRRRELARYHDIAASTKVRGAGIGFAGVGIKIALLACSEVLTETRRRGHHVASAWRLASRQKAPWRWVPPPGLVADHGTAVRLILANALSPLVDAGFIEASLRRNFQPLFEPALADILREHYSRGVVFVLNGRALEMHDSSAYVIAPLAIRLGRKRRSVGAGYLVRDAAPLREDLRGVAISTFGKVIKRGWDWLGLTPGALEHISGLIEVPALAECLALNKVDFIRAGARGATYLAYRKAIQEAVSQQLTEWGDASESTERARRRRARPVERDLEFVLADLADDFPLLASLVEQRAGGQRRLAVAGARAASSDADARPRLAAQEPAIASTPPQPTEASDAAQPAASDAATATAPTSPAVGHVAGGMRQRRAARYRLTIGFESRPDEPELAHLVESTVWVNEAHSAYRRAVASRSEGYHVALAVALALATLAVDPAKEHAFITAFLARWGAAIERRKPRSRS